MAVQVYAHPDGSYQWVEGTYSDSDIKAANASGNAADWVRANAQVVAPPQGH